MTVQITAIGGYNEVGRQSTAVKVDDEVFIVDLGLHLDHYIRYTEDEEEDITTTSARGLRQAGAIPDWTSIKDWKEDVVGILLTHAHLDHLGAVPYMAHIFNVPIYGSPFTIALLKQLIADKDMEFTNELVIVEDSVQITPSVSVDFIPMTHSTVDVRMISINTKYGKVVIDNDYKLDDTPTLGKAPSRKTIMSMKGQVLAHIAECLYAPAQTHTPSESVAKQMLQDILLSGEFENRAVFVSTFSSHIARLHSLMEIGNAMGREVVFLGRSMSKYLMAAEEAKILTLPKHVQLIKYGSQINKFFRSNKDLSNYLIICTGHMGEQKAALNKLVDGKYPFRFKPGDVVVLASRVIPVSHIVASREELQRKLKDKQIRLYSDVHVSGHASREDIRWLLTHLKAKHIIPNHGIAAMTDSFIALAKEVGYTTDQIHNLHEGERITLVD